MILLIWLFGIAPFLVWLLASFKKGNRVYKMVITNCVGIFYVDALPDRKLAGDVPGKLGGKLEWYQMERYQMYKLKFIICSIISHYFSEGAEYEK